MLHAWGRAAEQPGRRPGRARTSDAEYVMWVQRRIEATQHEPRKPVKWLAEQHGPGRSAASVQNMLSKAVERGLAKSEPWRLTAKGKRLVAQAEKVAAGGGA